MCEITTIRSVTKIFIMYINRFENDIEEKYWRMDVRSFLGKIGHRLATNGGRVQDLWNLLDKAGIAASRASLDLWISKFRTHGTAESLARRICGGCRLRTDEEKIAMGYVLEENQQKRRVLYYNVREFIKNEFAIEYSMDSIRKIVLRNGISLHKERNQAPDVKVSIEEASEEALQELFDLESCGIISEIKKNPENVVCFDYITDTTRRFQFRTLSGKGIPWRDFLKNKNNI